MSRERIFNIPGVVLAFIAVFAVIHGIREELLTDDQDGWVLVTFAFVPGRFTYLFDPAGLADSFVAFKGESGRLQEEIARFFLGDGRPLWWTALTYAFLHGSWTHLGVNSLWLAAFGAPVARRFGPTRFLLFFAITGIAGAATHYLFHRYDLAPVIGASASVSGLTAAAIRFVFQPNAPLGLGLGASGEAAYRQPALPLARVLRDGRVLPFLIVWFIVNFAFGASSQSLGLSPGPVAWEAHAGGFLAGLLLFALFDPAAGGQSHQHGFRDEDSGHSLSD